MSEKRAATPAQTVDPSAWIVIAAISERGQVCNMDHILTGVKFQLTARSLAGPAQITDPGPAAEVWIRRPGQEPETLHGRRAVLTAYQLVNAEGLNAEGRQKIVETASRMDAALYQASAAMSVEAVYSLDQ